MIILQQSEKNFVRVIIAVNSGKTVVYSLEYHPSYQKYSGKKEPRLVFQVDSYGAINESAFDMWQQAIDQLFPDKNDFTLHNDVEIYERWRAAYELHNG